MWTRFVSWLRSTRLGTWFATDPLKAMAAVCIAFVVLAFAVGALVPCSFVQNVAADLIGGLLAGLVIFGLANIAFGFTERRESERHALRMAYRMLLLEILENQLELIRIETALRGGSLTRNDPVFGPGERLSAENWQLLAQGPLVAQLPPDLFMSINVAYHKARRFESDLKEQGLALGVGNPQAWKAFCKSRLAAAEGANDLMASAHDKLHIAHERTKGS